WASALSRSWRANQSAAEATASYSGSRGSGPVGPRSGIAMPTRRATSRTAGGAAVKRARGAKVRPGALELHVLADDPHDVRRFPDLLDHVVGNETHAVNSTIVTPCPPWFGGAKPKRATRVSADKRSCTSWRSAPVPLPWMTRRYGRSA